MIATSHSSPGAVRFRLREATAEAHRKLEAAMALTQRCADRASYGALLADLWGVYAPLEAELAALDWNGLGVELAQRAKTPWLCADLITLGLSSGGVAALPRASQLPSIQSPADGFGVLYVLEGASLGGQLILRQIKASLGLDEQSGARFFSSYGAEVGERWRSFVAAMAAYGETERRVQAMERAALATFECFLTWINERASRSAEGAPHVR
jgi:heme oxygenase (biliverdin-IX-beta and delta-forming)